MKKRTSRVSRRIVSLLMSMVLTLTLVTPAAFATEVAGGSGTAIIEGNANPADPAPGEDSENNEDKNTEDGKDEQPTNPGDEDKNPGEGEGDDEVLYIDFTKVPADVERIAITVTIYEAQERGQNFGQVSNAYVRLARRSSENDSVGTEELRYDLGEDFSVETALVVCELYRSGATWKFNAVGAGYQGGLYALCKAYGVNV